MPPTEEAVTVTQERPLAQYWFEIGFGSCWAEAFIRNGEKPPFELTDAVIDRAWEVAPECNDDTEEFDRRLAQANEADERFSTPSSADVLVEALAESIDGVLHFEDALDYRTDTLSNSLRQWLVELRSRWEALATFRETGRE